MPNSVRGREPVKRTSAWLSELSSQQATLQQGAAATQAHLDKLVEIWQPRLGATGAEAEPLILVDDTGCNYEPILTAPRWLCHILALRHRAAHVLLVWDSPKLGPTFVCQVRSWLKKDFPGRVDISVGGHVVGAVDSQQTALIEMKEEIGMQSDDLTESGLVFVGGYECYIAVEDRHFYDVEWRDVYLGHLTSLNPLNFTDGEVSGIYLCPQVQAHTLLQQPSIAIANGLIMSLPLCLEYLETQQARTDL